MRLNTSATIDIAQPRDTVFDFACACETYVKLFRPRGSIAGVAAAQILDGALRAGARRRMTLTDGAVIDEDVVAFDRPTRHTYRWTGGLRAPARFLVRGVKVIGRSSSIPARRALLGTTHSTLRRPLCIRPPS